MSKDLTAESVFEGLRSAYPELDDPQHRKFLLHFLPTITFDIRGAFNVIYGCFELIREAPEDFLQTEDATKVIEMGYSAAAKLGAFIGGISLCAKYVADKDRDDSQ